VKPDETRVLKRNIFQRLFGKCATQEPNDPTCWTYADGRLEVDLSKARELSSPGFAIRIESKNLPDRVLVVHGDDDKYHAFLNRCTHGSRRLDPVPGAGTVQCCSVGKTTFDYSGKVLSGSGKNDITTYPVRAEEGKLIVDLQ
jgi:nitrite reductase/ring-hydroxylating ferredoxin subunit